MIKIEHVALWARDIEVLRQFYETYFEAEAGPEYVNEPTGFRSYFLTFLSGARLEIMKRPDVKLDKKEHTDQESIGYSHLAFSLGSEEAVDFLSKRLVEGGVLQLNGPRRTGDGYYESLFLDPEGNRIEITV